MCLSVCFFFNDASTTEIYTLSLHDALPIWQHRGGPAGVERVLPADRLFAVPGVHPRRGQPRPLRPGRGRAGDRKSTRLNSSHANISYAVFCLKKTKSNNAQIAVHHECAAIT